MHAHKVTFKRKKKLVFFIAFIAQFRNVYRSSIESRITIMWYIYIQLRLALEIQVLRIQLNSQTLSILLSLLIYVNT